MTKSIALAIFVYIVLTIYSYTMFAVYTLDLILDYWHEGTRTAFVIVNVIILIISVVVGSAHYEKNYKP